jgi:hypothetical protein
MRACVFPSRVGPKFIAAAIILIAFLYREQAHAQNSPSDIPARESSSTAPAIAVDHFKVRYHGDILLRHPELPSEEELERLTVTLKEIAGTLVPATKSKVDSPQEVIALGASGTLRHYSAEALMEGVAAIVENINRRGFFGIFVNVESKDLDAAPNEKDPTAEDGHSLTFRIYVTEVGTAQSTRYRLPISKATSPAIDQSSDSWIKNHSPILPGGLLKKDALQEYLDRLNRFPGRRVDTSLSKGKTDGTLDINYLIREERNLFCNYQISNTGSNHTSAWRSQLGVEYRHLTRLDDYLRASYSTTDYHLSNSGNLSYDTSLVSPDYLKSRTYGSAGQSTSEDLGQISLGFDSSQYTVGQQFVWTPRYIHGWPLDLTLGAYWMHVDVDNRSSEIHSNTDFILPYFGVGTTRTRESYALLASIQWEANLPRLAGTNPTDFGALGRFDADKNFSVIRWNSHASLWLDPIFYGKDWEESKIWWKACRAHELSGTLRGQAALNGGRLVPQMEAVVGGFDSARGYPESYTAGDTALISSVEYRFHIARQCVKPSSEIEPGRRSTGPDLSPSQDQPAAGEKSSRGFMFRPPSVASVADWDLIWRSFVDFARTENNEPLPAVESNKSLLSVGFGIELQTYRPAFCAIRADLGFALRGDHHSTGNGVDTGDARLHVSATIAW